MILIVYLLAVVLDVLASSSFACDPTVRMCRIVSPSSLHMTDVVRGLGPVLVVE